MEYEEIVPILVFGGSGAFCGGIVAVTFRRHQHPFAQTVLWSAIVAPLVALAFVVFVVIVATIWRFGFNPIWVIGAVLWSVVVLAFSLPVVCGVPAAIAGLITQCGIQSVSYLKK